MTYGKVVHWIMKRVTSKNLPTSKDCRYSQFDFSRGVNNKYYAWHDICAPILERKFYGLKKNALFFIV